MAFTIHGVLNLLIWAAIPSIKEKNHFVATYMYTKIVLFTFKEKFVVFVQKKTSCSEQRQLWYY